MARNSTGKALLCYRSLKRVCYTLCDYSVSLPSRADRLLRVLEQYYDQLTDEERMRNVRGPDRLFISGKHRMADYIRTIYEQNKRCT